MKKVLFINGSPKKNGNTYTLCSWLKGSSDPDRFSIKTVHAADLKNMHPGCNSCRACQNNKEYGCIIKDDVSALIQQMAESDIIAMLSPLYFFSASAQLKIIIDRMFSLYKWDNSSDTFTSPLVSKTLLFIGSAYESLGMECFEKPFALTAEYTGMKYDSILIANAGVSGELSGCSDIRDRIMQFGKKYLS